MTVREWDGERVTPAAQSGTLQGGVLSKGDAQLWWFSVKFCAMLLCHLFETLVVKIDPILQAFRHKADISVAGTPCRDWTPWDPWGCLDFRRKWKKQSRKSSQSKYHKA